MGTTLPKKTQSHLTQSKSTPSNKTAQPEAIQPEVPHTQTTQPDQERRRDVRLAGGPKVDAILVDDNQYPVGVLRDAQVLNISAGGMAMISPIPTDRGVRIQVVWGQGRGPLTQREQVGVEVLDCSAWGGEQYKIRCRLVTGRMPAELIYGW